MNRAKAKEGEAHPSARSFKIVLETHSDGYMAYLLGLKGVRSVKATPRNRL